MIPAPMKAADLKPLIEWQAADPFKPIEQYLTGAYAAEEKIDGCRALLVMGETANRFGELRAASFPQFRDAVVPALAGTVLDGEFTAPPGTAARPLLSASASLFNSGTARAGQVQRLSGPGEFRVFDVLAVQGQDVTGHTWEQRRQHLEIIVAWIRAEHPSCPVSAVPVLPATRQAITSVLAGGGEGVMLKRRTSRYHPGRRTEAWLKIKASATCDAFVTGWRPGDGYNTGRVGSVELSVMTDSGPRPVAHINIPPAWRREITAPDGSLRPEIIGTVIEFTGHGIGASGTINLPIFCRLRPDKAPADCGDHQLAAFTLVV